MSEELENGQPEEVSTPVDEKSTTDTLNELAEDSETTRSSTGCDNEYQQLIGFRTVPEPTTECLSFKQSAKRHRLTAFGGASYRP